MSTLKDVKDNSFHIEEKWCSFCLHFPDKINDLDINLILNEDFKLILLTIREIVEKEMKFSLEELAFLLKAKNDELSNGYLKSVYEKYNDFENIEYVKSQIKKAYLTNNINPLILEDILVELNSAKELNLTKLKDLSNSLEKNISKIESKVKIYNAEEVGNVYKSILQERKDGKKFRTFGYSVIDKHLVRGAEPKEMSLYIAQKGVGKSSLVQNMINKWLNKKVPVFFNSLEMSLEPVTDKFVTMRSGMPLREIYNFDDEDGDHKFISIKRVVEKFSRIKHFYYQEEIISISELEHSIEEVKKNFLKDGVITKENPYFIVVLDLASMLRDIAGADPKEIEPMVNKLHEIAKKHYIHMALIVQANENKLRGKLRFKKPSEIDYFVLTEEDVKGASVWAERCRYMFSITRPLLMKKKYFPDQNEEWDYEDDILWFQCIKNNMGNTFREPFIFYGETFKILPFKRE